MEEDVKIQSNNWKFCENSDGAGYCLCSLDDVNLLSVEGDLTDARLLPIREIWHRDITLLEENFCWTMGPLSCDYGQDML